MKVIEVGAGKETGIESERETEKKRKIRFEVKEGGQYSRF
jgi:hypothetical protein